MQDITAQNLSFITRLEKLKLVKGWTWEQVAENVGISRTMIHFIKSGKHGVTAKSWHRLEEAERSARSTQPLSDEPDHGGLTEAIASAEATANVEITSKDIDRGYIDVPLIYRRGVPPEGFPSKIRVSAPSAEAAAKALTAIKQGDDSTLLLALCLPPKFSTRGFFDKLSPFCYNAIVRTALAMTLGVDWQKKSSERR